MWTEISQQISQATGKNFQIASHQSIGGGCINRVYVISNQTSAGSPHPDRYLVKINRSSLVGMFAAEAAGLRSIAETKTIKAPLPICWGISGEWSYLAIEYLDLTSRANAENWTEMGRNLAALHRCPITNSYQFGWQIDNTIGSTSQINTWERDWTTFFTNHRIGYQLQLAQQNGGHFPRAMELVTAIPRILANYQPKPALVHGDLWSGNASFTTAGIPVIYDPATYWGDREVDLAMTELFGGFPAAFYQGYNEVYPLDPGYSQRQVLYNLYHILNHYNLFGGSYQSQANSAIDTLLRI